MSKRKADRELNQDNWDDDEVPTIVSDVEIATKGGISGRKILRASVNRTKVGTTGLFKGFTGLSNSSDGSSPFNFALTTSNTQNTKSAENSKETDYLRTLQNLNQSLLQWVSKHIQEDPHCILTPVFTDYEKHLKSLNDNYPECVVRSEDVSNGMQSVQGATLLKHSKSDGDFLKNTPLSFMSTPISNVTSEATSKPTFNFGMLPTATTSVTSKPEFRFSASFPPANSLNTNAPTTHTANADEDEEYVPPKPVVSEIKEPDSVFTVRCKLFYKLESEWRERGVGNLFIKPTGEDKFQLLVRADTNLGNILLNVMITRDIPIKLQKNNVTLVCVPSPPIPTPSQKQAPSLDPTKPVPLLIRVKTEKEGDELLLQFNKYRCMTTD